MSKEGFHVVKGITIASNIEEKKISDDKCEFIFKPLEAGFGITIGNALRRILLSSIEGYAINYVKVAGVKHEFGVISGVCEDMVDIVLNLKQLRFRKIGNKSEEIIKLNINKSVFIGEDINAVSSNFEVVNKDFEICHFSKNQNFEMEMSIIKGTGWKVAKKFEVGKDQIGTIFIDSIFSPVKNVKLDVDDARIGEKVGYDSLNLEVTTDGTVTPFSCLQHAISLLKSIFESFEDKSVFIEPETNIIENLDVQLIKMQTLLNTEIEKLGFKLRALNCLKSADIVYVKDLVQLKEDDLKNIDNLGMKTLTEINDFFKKNNLTFGMDISKYNL